MLKFLDLNTGYSFDGLWTEDQQKGYIFWFPKEQSTGLIYTMPVAIVSDSNEDLKLSMDENDIFSFISCSDEITEVDGYQFNGEPVHTYETTVSCSESVNGKYIYLFNIAAKSDNSGEYISQIKIENKGFIRVGADFYCEYEPVYINLSNMGVEIPDTVQKAIYDSNVHEDNIDNILINRKLKELLSNYWDIIANKGSYKSLVNSLEWFEWPNILKIREIWKHQQANKTYFSDDDMLNVLEDKIEESMSNFIKTSYISLYCALQNETGHYDIEYNPEIERAIFKWSRNDIQLKIALLAKFFGIYFMPIHMSILHAVAEDVVFTNTIKSIVGSEIKRKDHFGDLSYVECNISDKEIFKLSNVRAQVSPTTIFVNDYTDDSIDKNPFGVDVYPKKAFIDVSSIGEFAKHYYGGPGVIIPVNMTIPNQTVGDFIKQTMVQIDTNTGISRKLFLYDILKTNKRDNCIHIDFNMLLMDAAEYAIRFTFMLASGNTITRRLNIVVEDADNLNINVYKIHAKDDSNGFTVTDFEDTQCAKYVFKTQKDKTHICYTQYLPYLLPDDPAYANYNGIKLNRTIIVDLRSLKDKWTTESGFNKDKYNHEVLVLRSIMYYHDYLEYASYNTDDEMTFMIFISKKFYAPAPPELFDNKVGHYYQIIRNSLGFYPQFHYLEKMDGDNIDNYTVKPYEAVCCAAEINSGDKVIDFRYSHLIDEVEWSFFNHITKERIEDSTISSIQPFVAKSTNDVLNPGYYDITFRYSLSNGNTGKCSLNSAFRIKS